MQIQFKKKNITNLSEWKELVFTGKKGKHWKEGRSAYALADFICNKNGINQIQQLLSTVIPEKFELQMASPEYEARFDKFGHGREHDLAIYGLTENKKKIFIGLESKVDEPFGDTIQTAYIKAKTNEINGVKTNIPKRIERLLESTFHKIKETDFQLRYQLLFSTAGTLCIKADIHVFLILVFKTQSYQEQIGKLNKTDFGLFLKRIEAKEYSPYQYKAYLHDKELNIIYKEIECK